MSVVQVSLDQVLSALKESLHSIDLRAAVVHADKLQSLVTGVRISARSVSAAKERQIKLIKDLGQGEAGSFKVLYDALAFSRLNDVLQELEQGRLTVAGYQIHFPDAIRGDSLRGYVTRNQHFVRAWDGSPVPAFYSYLKFSPVGFRSDLLRVKRGRIFTFDALWKLSLNLYFRLSLSSCCRLLERFYLSLASEVLEKCLSVDLVRTLFLHLSATLCWGLLLEA